MKRRKKYSFYKSRSFFLVLIVVAILFLGVGYAQIANVNLRVSGTTDMEPTIGIVIQDISYLSGNNSNPDIQVLDSPYLSLLSSRITLNNDLTSSISYKIRFYNNTPYSANYDQAITSSELGYDNNDIVFEVTGLSHGEEINPGETKECTITFKYKNGLSAINNNVLNSVINFRWDLIEPVAKIGTQEFFTLQEAVNAATGSDQVVITVLKDLQENINVAQGKNVKVDLNGHEICNDGVAPVFTIYGSLYLTGGTVKSDTTQGALTLKPNTNSNLVVDGLRVEATGTRQAIYNEKGYVLIKGDSYLSSVSTERATVHNLSGGTLIIESGTIVSTNYHAVYNNNNSPMTIGVSDGTAHKDAPVFIGAKDGINSTNAFNFYDGVAKGKDRAIYPLTLASSNMEPDCELAALTEVINGDTYKVTYPAIVATVTFNANSGSTSESIRRIEKGYPLGELPFASRTGYKFEGWFTDKDNGEQVSAETIIEDDITIWAHWTKLEHVADVNGTIYDTLQAAINSTSSGTPTTITLLKDTYENLNVPRGKIIDLDLNDYTLTNNASNKATIENHGDLTVTGGIVTANSEHAAINQEEGNIYINARIVSVTDRQAVYVNGGYAHIYGDSYLTSKAIDNAINTSTLRGTVQCRDNCTLLITGGTIIGEKQHAISNTGNMTIGVKDGNPDQSVPVIRGEKSGIYNSGTFNFYDGISQGRESAIDGTVTDTETTLVDTTVEIDGKTYYSKYNG